ncbi:hypothetical protein VTK73DRAFT_2141 [Phialemonium thermophilum]|uniref:Uncharacterized protein n=1 Tax=Phialemonium thermophilum TaxID=223376 RepID=A0ABR3X6Q8_9PEZI
MSTPAVAGGNPSLSNARPRKQTRKANVPTDNRDTRRILSRSGVRDIRAGEKISLTVSTNRFLLGTRQDCERRCPPAMFNSTTIRYKGLVTILHQNGFACGRV